MLGCIVLEEYYVTVLVLHDEEGKSEGREGMVGRGYERRRRDGKARQGTRGTNEEDTRGERHEGKLRGEDRRGCMLCRPSTSLPSC